MRPMRWLFKGVRFSGILRWSRWLQSPRLHPSMAAEESQCFPGAITPALTPFPPGINVWSVSRYIIWSVVSDHRPLYLHLLLIVISVITVVPTLEILDCKGCIYTWLRLNCSVSQTDRRCGLTELTVLPAFTHFSSSKNRVHKCSPLYTFIVRKNTNSIETK